MTSILFYLDVGKKGGLVGSLLSFGFIDSRNYVVAFLSRVCLFI